MDGAADTETRTYTPTELAFLVSAFRQAQGWSQETLAELACVTPRTVQRVEAAEPSSLDTRRALARAFGMDDIDAFIRPREFITPEGAAKQKAEFDRRFVVIDTKPKSGRELARALAESGPYRALHTGMVGEPPEVVEDVYAAVMDHLRGMLDVLDEADHVEMLGYADQLEGMLADLRTHGWEVSHGSRRVLLTQAKLPCELSYIVLVPAGGGDRQIAVQKSSSS